MTPRIPFINVDPHQRLKAIGLMVLATICFTVLDTTAKYLVTTKAMPVAEVTWLRFVGHVVFSAAALWPFALKPSLRSAKPLVQAFRSIVMICTTALNFLALRYLQLDQTVTIFFLTPLLVALLAGPLLHEWVGWHRMVAIVAGFVGVLIVMHPGLETFRWAMLFALVATLCYAFYNLSTRYLAAYDPAEVTQTYTPLAGVVIMAPSRLPLAGATRFQHADSACHAWFLGRSWTLAVDPCPSQRAWLPVLAPFIYLGLIWMSVAGYLVFADLPTLWTLSGGAIVILAGLYLFARERKALGPKAIGPASDIASQ